MKLSHLFAPSLLALSALLSPTAHGQMVAANDRVRVEVKVNATNDKKDIANSNASTTTQHKTLVATLNGKAKSPETRVIKWKAYGRDMKNNNQKVIESGELPLALDARGTQTFESKGISTTYTPDHSIVSKGGGGGRGGNNRNPKATKVEGSGTKFVGYSIEVVDGSTVVGEFSDPVGIAKEK